ncbi:MAG: hypothetical protein RLN75_09635 [Longimicrobiales bacterium]
MTAVTIALVACGQADAPGGEPVTELDSAGVRIVRSDTSGVQTMTLGDPVQRHGDIDGDGPHLFSRIADGLFTADGFVVADAGSMEVRAFDSDGTHLWSFGARGQGPGEFLDLARIERYRGDSLVVFDRGTQRATVIAGDGSGARVVSMTGGPGRPIRYVIPLDDGSMVARSSGSGSGHAQPHRLFRDPVVLERFAAEGRWFAHLLEIPGDDMYRHPTGTGVAINNHPVGRIPSFTSDGARILVAEGTRAAVEIWSVEGALQARFEVEVVPPTVTPEVRTSVLESFLGDPEPGFRREIEALFEALEWPERLPGASALVRGRAGGIWIRGGVVPGESSARWWRLNDAGRLITRVEVPLDVRVLDTDGARVLGVDTDDLGVERIAAYPLVAR